MRWKYRGRTSKPHPRSTDPCLAILYLTLVSIPQCYRPRSSVDIKMHEIKESRLLHWACNKIEGKALQSLYITIPTAELALNSQCHFVCSQTLPLKLIAPSYWIELLYMYSLIVPIAPWHTSAFQMKKLKHQVWEPPSSRTNIKTQRFKLFSLLSHPLGLSLLLSRQKTLTVFQKLTFLISDVKVSKPARIKCLFLEMLLVLLWLDN